MEPPVGLTMRQLEETVMEFSLGHYRSRDTDKKLVCSTCGTLIVMLQGKASVCFGSHQDNVPCGGGGDVEDFVLPYCPACEGEPKTIYTCVHTHPRENAA